MSEPESIQRHIGHLLTAVRKIVMAGQEADGVTDGYVDLELGVIDVRVDFTPEEVQQLKRLQVPSPQPKPPSTESGT
jgi:uncharacterized Ntn-hydrolase superfamily protein